MTKRRLTIEEFEALDRMIDNLICMQISLGMGSKILEEMRRNEKIKKKNLLIRFLLEMVKGIMGIFIITLLLYAIFCQIFGVTP